MASHPKYQQLTSSVKPDPSTKSWRERKLCWDSRLTLLLLSLLLLLLLLTLALLAVPQMVGFGPEASDPRETHGPCEPSTDSCRLTVVESIPEGMDYSPGQTVSPSVFEAWRSLIASASESLDIASFYWALNNTDTGTATPSAWQGEEILRDLISVSGRMKVRIAVNKPSKNKTSTDLNSLSQSGAEVREVDMARLTAGVLHTKFWVVDNKHVFIGSPNMDWRSLTQVKELGAVVYNCSCLAEDLLKIFEQYWFLGLGGDVPTVWPPKYSTEYNIHTPLLTPLNSTPSQIYFSNSPPPLNARGRTNDLTSILTIIADAKEFVDIAVMDYIPVSVYDHPQTFWPAIDIALRGAAFDHRVRIRLLVSCWKHTDPVMFPFLKSLAALANHRLQLTVKMFIVPATEAQEKIPYSRVNHNKYLVTDRVGYIGTSNWSGDYFTQTAGVGLAVNQTGTPQGLPRVSERLREVFERDWNSRYSTRLNASADSPADVCRQAGRA